MKKILIDARWLTNSVRGIGVFTRNLIYALIENSYEEVEFYLAVRKKFVPSLSCELPVNFHIVPIPDWCPDPILDLVFFNYLAKKVSADVVHFTGNTGFIFKKITVSVTLTLHDVSFLKGADVVPFPHRNLRQAIGRLYRKALVPFYAKSATNVCTVSEFALQDIKLELGIASEFIYHGFELPVIIGNLDQLVKETEHRKLGQPEYLTITGADPQKNLYVSVSAFISLHRKYKKNAPRLTVIGVTQTQYKRINPDAELTENILFLGMLSHREISGHIHRCKALIIPSFYESFGLPVIESLSFHKAPLCSKGGALPEIGSSFAHYFDPHDYETLVKLIEAVEMGKLLIKLPGKQVDQYLEKFRWSKVAQFYLRQYGARIVPQDRGTAL